MLLVFAALLTAPVQAQSSTEIWSAELTAGNDGNQQGFCLGCSLTFMDRSFGSLSDRDFELSGTTYVVEAILWLESGANWISN